MSIGDRIKEYRKKHKFTQRDLADKVNVSPQVISNWERNYTTPDSDDIFRLARVFEILVDELSPEKQESNKAMKNNDFDSLSEINRILTDLGVTDFFMHNIEDWKDLTPEQVDELRRDFESFLEYKAFEAKKMKKEAKKDPTKEKN